MADARAGERVVHEEAAALRVAHGVQAGDDVVVGVEDLEVNGGLEAAHAHEQHGVGQLVAVERRVLDGEHAVGTLAEVLVDALLGQLVVALDRGAELLHRHAHLLGELLDGVGLNAGVGCHGLVEHGLRDVGVAAVGTAGHLVVVNVPAHVAVAAVHVLQLVGPLGVEDLPGGLLGQAAELVLEGLATHVLVHEAVAVDVGQQEGVHAQGTAQVVGHRGEGAVLHLGADPHAHALAVTGVRGVAGGVAVGEDAGKARGPRHVVGHHVLVAGEVARGEQDGLGGVDLRVVAVDVLADDARDGALVVLADELAGPRGELEGYACLDADVVDGLDPRCHGGKRDLAVAEDGIEVVLGVGVVRLGPVRLAHGEVALVHVVGVALVLNDVLALHRCEEPVERLAGVVGPKVEDALVGTVAALLHELAHGGVAVDLDAQVLLDLAADGAELVGAALPGVGLLDDDDVLGAVLNGGAAGAQAGKGGTDDDDVGVDGLLDVGGVDGRGGLHEGRRVGGVFLGLVGQGARHGAGQGGRAGDGGGAGDERTARKVCHVLLLVSRADKNVRPSFAATQRNPSYVDVACRRIVQTGHCLLAAFPQVECSV